MNNKLLLKEVAKTKIVRDLLRQGYSPSLIHKLIVEEALRENKDNQKPKVGSFYEFVGKVGGTAGFIEGNKYQVQSYDPKQPEYVIFNGFFKKDDDKEPQQESNMIQWTKPNFKTNFTLADQKKSDDSEEKKQDNQKPKEGSSYTFVGVSYGDFIKGAEYIVTYVRDNDQIRLDGPLKDGFNDKKPKQGSTNVWWKNDYFKENFVLGKVEKTDDSKETKDSPQKPEEGTIYTYVGNQAAFKGRKYKVVHIEGTDGFINLKDTTTGQMDRISLNSGELEKDYVIDDAKESDEDGLGDYLKEWITDKSDAIFDATGIDASEQIQMLLIAGELIAWLAGAKAVKQVFSVLTDAVFWGDILLLIKKGKYTEAATKIGAEIAANVALSALPSQTLAKKAATKMAGSGAGEWILDKIGEKGVEAVIKATTSGAVKKGTKTAAGMLGTDADKEEPTDEKTQAVMAQIDQMGNTPEDINKVTKDIQSLGSRTDKLNATEKLGTKIKSFDNDKSKLDSDSEVEKVIQAKEDGLETSLFGDIDVTAIGGLEDVSSEEGKEKIISDEGSSSELKTSAEEITNSKSKEEVDASVKTSEVTDGGELASEKALADKKKEELTGEEDEEVPEEWSIENIGILDEANKFVDEFFNVQYLFEQGNLLKKMINKLEESLEETQQIAARKKGDALQENKDFNLENLKSSFEAFVSMATAIRKPLEAYITSAKTATVGSKRKKEILDKKLVKLFEIGKNLITTLNEAKGKKLNEVEEPEQEPVEEKTDGKKVDDFYDFVVKITDIGANAFDEETYKKETREALDEVIPTLARFPNVAPFNASGEYKQDMSFYSKEYDKIIRENLRTAIVYFKKIQKGGGSEAIFEQSVSKLGEFIAKTAALFNVNLDGTEGSSDAATKKEKDRDIPDSTQVSEKAIFDLLGIDFFAQHELIDEFSAIDDAKRKYKIESSKDLRDLLKTIKYASTNDKDIENILKDFFDSTKTPRVPKPAEPTDPESDIYKDKSKAMEKLQPLANKLGDRKFGDLSDDEQEEFRIELEKLRQQGVEFDKEAQKFLTSKGLNATSGVASNKLEEALEKYIEKLLLEAKKIRSFDPVGKRMFRAHGGRDLEIILKNTLEKYKVPDNIKHFITSYVDVKRSNFPDSKWPQEELFVYGISQMLNKNKEIFFKTLQDVSGFEPEEEEVEKTEKEKGEDEFIDKIKQQSVEQFLDEIQTKIGMKNDKEKTDIEKILYMSSTIDALEKVSNSEDKELPTGRRSEDIKKAYEYIKEEYPEEFKKFFEKEEEEEEKYKSVEEFLEDVEVLEKLFKTKKNIDSKENKKAVSDLIDISNSEDKELPKDSGFNLKQAYNNVKNEFPEEFEKFFEKEEEEEEEEELTPEEKFYIDEFYKTFDFKEFEEHYIRENKSRLKFNDNVLKSFDFDDKLIEKIKFNIDLINNRNEGAGKVIKKHILSQLKDDQKRREFFIKVKRQDLAEKTIPFAKLKKGDRLEVKKQFKTQSKKDLEETVFEKGDLLTISKVIKNENGSKTLKFEKPKKIKFTLKDSETFDEYFLHIPILVPKFKVSSRDIEDFGEQIERKLQVIIERFINQRKQQWQKRTM